METISSSLEEIQRRLDHVFSDPSILEVALTHSSFANEHYQLENSKNPEANHLRKHYERLEFLGDAVVELVVSHLLMDKFETAAEGDLSRMRAGLVNTEYLAGLARELGLGETVRLGRGEQETGGMDKPSILAAVYESLIAAVYIDGGYVKAFKVVSSHFENIIAELSPLELIHDFKTPLQEKVQALKRPPPTYRVVGEEGPDHMKMFEVEILVAGKALARGQGRSKKEAEQEAARKVLQSGILDE